jgi:hypothetical protein
MSLVALKQELFSGNGSNPLTGKWTGTAYPDSVSVSSGGTAKTNKSCFPSAEVAQDKAFS